MSKTILLTGGCGFVGHHFVEHFVRNTDYKVVVMDKLNYSGSLNRLRDIECYPMDKVEFLSHDFSLPIKENLEQELAKVTDIIHMGAESHVDNSITHPEKFCTSNVTGTVNMLQLARRLPKLDTFYYFSTDEVFGPADFNDTVGFGERDIHNPGNPYAASKSAGDMFVRSFANTYGLRCVTTQTMNVFGERQHPEKYIPMCIRKIRDGETVTVHATKDKLSAGKRTYIHARNVADAYQYLLDQAVLGIKQDGWYKSYRNFNIVGELEVDNLRLAEYIAQIMDRPLHYKMVDFHSSRPGHDLRYALDGSEMKRIGWQPPKTFLESLEKTVQWYLENEEWLEV